MDKYKYEKQFFCLFKDSDLDYSVATICVEALMCKYGLDKDFSNSGEICPKEAMVEVYDNAVKYINEVSQSIDVRTLDLDPLFAEIENNLKELHDDVERKEYCHSLLLPFGFGCSFIDTYLPVARINGINKGIGKYEREKTFWENYTASDEVDEVAKETNIRNLNSFIESDKKRIEIVRSIALNFVMLSPKGPVEKFYSGLYRLLQRYASRLAWTFVKYDIDIFSLQNKWNIYIIDPQKGHDVLTYAQWAGSLELAQKYVDDINKKQRLPKVLDNDAAKTIMMRAVNAGFLNENYQPISKKMTRAQQKRFAALVCKELNISNYNKVFQDWWGCDYNRVSEVRGSYKKLDLINRMFDPSLVSDLIQGK